MPKNPAAAILLRRTSFVAALCFVASISSSARAQAHYYNLDAGRPSRVVDAEAGALYALDFDVAPVQFERLTGGTNRYRVEPMFSYGVLPFTDIELRFPYVHVQPPRESGAPSITGGAGVSVGATHQFNIESSTFPALALASEVTLPVGTLAPERAAYIVKALMTKTTSIGRLHVNVGGGTWALPAPPDTNDVCTNGTLGSLQVAESGNQCSGIPIIIDTPCSVRPASGASARTMCNPGARSAEPPGNPLPPSATPTGPLSGTHWFAGVGYDRALPLSSTVVTADVFSERLIGLYSSVDWTAELGARRQLTPSLVVDAGAGWHFAGVVRSFSIVLGATFEVATPPLDGR